MSFNVIEFFVNEFGDPFRKTIKKGLKRTRAREVADHLNDLALKQDLKGESKGIRSYLIESSSEESVR